ncbi:T9SS type A sorting domain-containing protein [Ekhidna sp.]|uniref:T9SS type A sorting domain-containing protein n=1 Tax=Ekhidna sp. TaxID=2608089 RepID=UPI00329A2ADA
MIPRNFHFKLLVITFLTAASSHAQTWVGGGSNWNDPTNWSSNPSLPSNGSTITIDGLLATVDVFSAFRPGQINILNGGQLEVKDTLDISSEGVTSIDGSGSKLIVADPGLFTAEFITATNGGEIEITGGELDVDDQLSMTNGVFSMTGGLLDYNGSTGEELLFTNSDVTFSGGTLEFNRGIIVTGGTFTQEDGSTMTATNSSKNIEFHNTLGSFAGIVNNSTGDLSLFGTSVIDLMQTLDMDLDDLVMNDDGQSSVLNIYGTVVAFDDVKFDEDPPDDVPGDADMIIVKDGGSLTISDSFRDGNDVESGSGIHAEDGATVDIGDVPGMTDEEAYGTILTSDPGATMTIGGGAPLPVELVSFTGRKKDSGIDLSWITAVEINNDHFELLRSTDGKTFNSIAKVSGAGNTNSEVRYSYSDLDVSNGSYFYQIKQVDFNGEYEFHEIIHVSFTDANLRSLSVFPNPLTSNHITVVSDIELVKPVLLVYSISGKPILEKQLDSNQRWTFNRSELKIPSGTYILKLKDEIHGATLETIKFSIID